MSADALDSPMAGRSDSPSVTHWHFMHIGGHASLLFDAARSRPIERPHRVPKPYAKALREKPGLSQTQFSALIGISPRALHRVAECNPEAVLKALHR